MLFQVLQLTPEQINALPPAERDAIQQLVGSGSPVIHVASSLRKADSFLFLCLLVFSLPCFAEESVHGWRHHCLMFQSSSRASQLFWLVAVSGFGVYVSHG